MEVYVNRMWTGAAQHELKRSGNLGGGVVESGKPQSRS